MAARTVSIAILRALQLGDLLCTVPALRAFRAAYPDAHIALIGLPWAAEFVQRYRAYVDEHIEFPGYPGLPEQPWEFEAVSRFVTEMRARRFDLVVQLQGDGSVVNPLVAMLGASRTAGFFAAGRWCPDPLTYAEYPEGAVQETHRLLRLPRRLGLPGADDDTIDFPLAPDDRSALRAIEGLATVLERPYVCVHAGSRRVDRRWPIERMAQAADALAAQGLRVVVTGSAAERPLVARLRAAMSAPATDVSGRTDLGALGALLAGARLVLTNDTGVSHLAVAVRAPSVVVFTTSDPARWAPLDTARHRQVGPAAEATGPDVASVLSAARTMLDISAPVSVARS